MVTAGEVRELLTAEASYAALDSVLERIESVGGTVESAAQELREPLSALTPEPQRALEAVGRLSFEELDAGALIRALGAALTAECGTSLLGDEVVEKVANLTPRRGGTPDDVIVGDLYGMSCVDAGPIQPFGFVYKCDDMGYEVDLVTGAVQHHTALDRTPTSFVVGPFAAAWTESVEIPASGVAEPSAHHRVHIYSFDTEEVVSVDVTEPVTAISVGDATVQRVLTDRVVVTSGQYADEQLISLDLAGNEIFRRSGHDLFPDAGLGISAFGSPFQGATESSVLIAKASNTEDDGKAPARLLDMRTGEVVPVHSGPAWKSAWVSGTNWCPGQALVRIGDIYDVVFSSIDDLPDGLSVTPVANSNEAVTSGSRVRDVLLAYVDHQSTVGGVGFDGTPLWQHERTVSRGAIPTFGWVRMDNTNEEELILDPATGQVVEDLDPRIESMILRGAPVAKAGDFDEKFVVSADRETDNAVIFDGEQVGRFKLSEVCPAA